MTKSPRQSGMRFIYIIGALIVITFSIRNVWISSTVTESITSQEGKEHLENLLNSPSLQKTPWAKTFTSNSIEKKTNNSQSGDLEANVVAFASPIQNDKDDPREPLKKLPEIHNQSSSLLPESSLKRIQDEAISNNDTIKTSLPSLVAGNTSDMTPKVSHALTNNTEIHSKHSPKQKSAIHGLYSIAELSSNDTIFNRIYNNSLSPQTSTIPWPNLTTYSYYQGIMQSGFRNQMMVFTIMLLEALNVGHGQFLMESAPHKDTYGSNRFIELWWVWDIAHWNRHYPQLPRLVNYDPILHDQYNISKRHFYRLPQEDGQLHFRNLDNSLVTKSPIHPFAEGRQSHHLFSAYIQYAKGKGPYLKQKGVDYKNLRRHPSEILMLQGALRPSAVLQAIIDEKLQMLIHDNDKDSNTTLEYMTLHARIEPDMQKHRVCWEKKVLNLTQIFEFIETAFPEPPVSRVFLPINREILEKTVRRDKKKIKDPSQRNLVAIDNLKALNQARDGGIWAGRVKVIEFGANVLKGTAFERRPSTTGAILNFFIGINAKIFVGTEVSSYSHDLLATRFYRSKMENYKYLPDGLHPWIPSHLKDPPGFHC